MPIKRIGHIANTFGLDGSLKVNMETDHPEIRFKEGNTVTIKGIGDFKVSKLRMKNRGTGQVKLVGLDDISQAEKLIGKDIVMDVEPLPGTYFVDDLIGLTVLSPEKKKVGEVKKVQKMGDIDYLILDSGLFIPFQAGRFVELPDLANRTIVLTPLGFECTL
ncbi:MAG TPA: 16S rRNA processing protein RimM [Firmicutes bacterium]|nr:16S rRNA processing protein RimM [Bacillota bacterium]